ncbi:MAG TPA: hypothetical protein VFQ07_14340, partial [Candidatus Polarisedimenticolia bacterium]|nr:hypothetical protein [Candidatus Polarisedimenticolia bacterium]
MDKTSHKATPDRKNLAANRPPISAKVDRDRGGDDASATGKKPPPWTADWTQIAAIAALVAALGTFWQGCLLR